MSTILIIEDDRSAVRILELSLKQEGYQVVTALDGLQGLELAQTQQPDLVLLD
jgi:DNA-binding response OmpR family regulator